MNLLIIKLAIKELVRRPVVSAVDIVMVAFSVCILLVLYGLKFGVINQLAVKLLQDPQHRRVVLVPNTVIAEADFNSLLSNPKVGWIVPSQASLAQQIKFKRLDSAFFSNRGFPVIPTDIGDPLLPAKVTAPTGNQIILSSGLASELEVSEGDAIVALITRNSRQQRIEYELTVSSVIDLPNILSKGGMLNYRLLGSIEQWMLGHSVEKLGWLGTVNDSEKFYNAVRLYARSLEDLTPLVNELNKRAGWTAKKRTGDVTKMYALDAILKRIFAIFMFLVIFGFSVVYVASLCKRVIAGERDYAALLSAGIPNSQLRLLPVYQSLAISISGFVVGSILALVFAHIISATLVSQAEGLGLDSGICQVLGVHLLACFVGVLIVSNIASVVAMHLGTFSLPWDVSKA